MRNDFGNRCSAIQVLSRVLKTTPSNHDRTTELVSSFGECSYRSWSTGGRTAAGTWTGAAWARTTGIWTVGESSGRAAVRLTTAVGIVSTSWDIGARIIGLSTWAQKSTRFRVSTAGFHGCIIAEWIGSWPGWLRNHWLACIVHNYGLAIIVGREWIEVVWNPIRHGPSKIQAVHAWVAIRGVDIEIAAVVPVWIVPIGIIIIKRIPPWTTKGLHPHVPVSHGNFWSPVFFFFFYIDIFGTWSGWRKIDVINGLSGLVDCAASHHDGSQRNSKNDLVHTMRFKD